MITKLLEFLIFVGENFNMITITYNYSTKAEIKYLRRNVDSKKEYSSNEVVMEYLKYKVNGATKA